MSTDQIREIRDFKLNVDYDRTEKGKENRKVAIGMAEELLEKLTDPDSTIGELIETVICHLEGALEKVPNDDELQAMRDCKGNPNKYKPPLFEGEMRINTPDE